MPKRALFLFTAALCLAAPFAAQAEDTLEAWTPTDSSIRATAAGISLPHSIATLSLTKSGEASNGGRGIDNYAQYVSQDGAVQAIGTRDEILPMIVGQRSIDGGAPRPQ